MAKKKELQKLLQEKKRLEEAKQPATSNEQAAAAEEVPSSSTPIVEPGYATPPYTNEFRLPGSPHGPFPPSPTSPASTHQGEPVETKKTSPKTRPLPTPVRVEENQGIHNYDQDGQASPEMYLHESQDRQVWSLKKSRKQDMVGGHDSPVAAVSADPYAPTVLDSPEKENEEPRLVLYIYIYRFQNPKPIYRKQKNNT